jgi:hypothetical protein
MLSSLLGGVKSLQIEVMYRQTQFVSLQLSLIGEIVKWDNYTAS